MMMIRPMSVSLMLLLGSIIMMCSMQTASAFVLQPVRQVLSTTPHLHAAVQNSLHQPVASSESFSAATTATSATRLQMAGPSVLEKPETIEKTKESTQQGEKYGTEAWEIRLYNDPFNKREFVARCLSTICGKSDTESFQIMMQAHQHGMGIVGRYNLEVAELYYKSLSENGLLVEMVPVDDE